MFETSYLIAICAGLACIFGGWMLYKILKGGQSKEWKQKFFTLEEESKSLAKQNNKLNKQVEQLRGKADSWKQEFHALTQDTQKIKKDHQLQLASINDQSNAIRSNFQTEKQEKERAVTALAKLQKEHEKLREKYNRDVAAGTEWRSERQKFERELKTTTDKLAKTTTIAEEYKGKYAEQAAEINKIRVMEREMRMMKTKLKKLEEDCTYWEKKHYDAHHELAQLKEKSQSLMSEYQELDDLRKGDQILKDNLMTQIQEFKTKFVNINNKYRDLVNNN